MKADKLTLTSRANSAKGGKRSEGFTWDPHADQVFTPDDGGEIAGTASSFDKDEGFSFRATGPAFMVVFDDDDGTYVTTWGRPSVSDSDGGPTIIETSGPSGQIIFASVGKLIVGNRDTPAELRVNHANGDETNSGPDDERVGMVLSARDIVFSNVIVAINNESGLLVGSQGYSASSLTIDWAQISVHNGSVCHLTPNAEGRLITVKSVLRVVIGDDSSVYMGGDSWNFSPDSVAQFSLCGSHQGAFGLASSNSCHLRGFDFLEGPHYPPGMFNFLTKDEDGSPMKNNGEFVFEKIGNGFQWAAILEKRLVAIDGVIITDPRLIPEDLRDGDLHIHLK